MRKTTLQLLIIGTAGLFLTSGCIYSHHMAAQEPVVAVPTGQVIVTEAPPAPRREVIGVAPDSTQVWIAGYWMHTN
ncbi:MAG: hypothetical protein ACTHLW_21920, partial [Verrucomicrobiota bacterium]